MLLSRHEIEELNKQLKASNDYIIDKYDEKASRNNPAKIEVRLGDKCYLSSHPKHIISLKEGTEIKLLSNELLIFQTYEKVHIPTDIAGRMSLKIRMIAKGLIMPNVTQIDPGYQNYIFGMIYNLSKEEVTLKYKEPIASLEFYRLSKSAGVYSGDIMDITLEEFVADRVTSSLGELGKEVRKSTKKLKRSVNMWNVIFSAITFLFLVLTVIVGIPVASGIGNYKDVNHLADQNKGDIEILNTSICDLENGLDALREDLSEYQDADTVIEYDERMDALERQIEALRLAIEEMSEQ
jgi:deoxycytidine triphosphate deaminase